MCDPNPNVLKQDLETSLNSLLLDRTIKEDNKPKATLATPSLATQNANPVAPLVTKTKIASHTEPLPKEKPKEEDPSSNLLPLSNGEWDQLNCTLTHAGFDLDEGYACYKIILTHLQLLQVNSVAEPHSY